MADVKMSNVKKRLSSCRKACPGLGTGVYDLAFYMSLVANDELVPAGMALCLAMCLEDFKKEKCGFSNAKAESSLSSLIKRNKTQILAQAVYFPQIIDAIASEEFATEFRTICKEMFEFDPPKRYSKYNLDEKIEGDYPEYVQRAVNWWANIIVNPIFDNGDKNCDLMAQPFLIALIVNSKKSIAAEQIDTFKKALADIIVKTLDANRFHECRLDVDYHPNSLLSSAIQAAGIDDDMGFPWKTTMIISEEKVAVSLGYNAPWKVLWEKD